MNYTKPQETAIKTTDQNLQIIACAGSGKTAVVAERIVNVLATKAAEGITPENVVAFTFTEKAAGELRDRITKLYRARFGHIEGLGGMYIGTIHGFCLDLLQRYLPDYLKCDVLDEVQQQLFIDRHYRKCGMASLETRSGPLKRWIESWLYIRMLGVLRESSIDAKKLKKHPARAALETYQDLLDEHRYLDYDEILVRAVSELIGQKQVRKQLADRVKYLTVDEYQDVNPIQEMLVSELHKLGANVCVVGDDDQNIYQWRGSDVETIRTFAKRYPKVVTVPLVKNFRSTKAVVDIAHKAIVKNKRRLPKAMNSSEKRPFDRGDLLCLEFDDPEEEATWIAEKIRRMVGTPYAESKEGSKRGLSWSDFAVLLRTVRRSASPIVEALRAENIPNIVTGMTGLFDTTEAQAAASIFDFMVGEIDEEDLRSLWREANVGLSDADLKRGAAFLTEMREFKTGKRFSAYNLQRCYLSFLETVGLTEERVPGGRGEVVFYNLGKFSQVISDFEEIHFKSKPQDKYASFVGFLHHQAPSYYPEGGQDVAYAVPDAVRIMTVHQAKGTEFPVVFLPCLQKNRFPSKKQANRVWSLIPREAVKNADRYDGDIEDERRLLYVALTRSEKYLFCSWAPKPDNQLYRKPSPFFEELSEREQFLTKEPKPKQVTKLPQEPRRPLVNVEISFSELKYFFECPYQFKLRFLYGFNPSLDEALGYGRSLHNALAEVHREALKGTILTDANVLDLLERHLYLRYAYPELEESLRASAHESLERYLREHRDQLSRLEHVEEDIQLSLENGIMVHGRIDLIRRTDTGETAIVDFKSKERVQADDVSTAQLYVYALGYAQRFGKSADLIEVHNLDKGGSKREQIDSGMLGEILQAVTDAGEKLRTNTLQRIETHQTICDACDVLGICLGKAARNAVPAKGSRVR